MVDQRLYASELPVTILGLTRLTDEPSKGISLLDAPRNPESTTSRELVAEVIVEVVNREDLLQPNRFEFDDGDDVPKI